MVKYRATGCLFGLALGDALGAPGEFMTVAEICRRFPTAASLVPAGNPALVTDDTQMALAVGEALAQAGSPLTAATLEPELRKAFVAWLDSPDNNRAPGVTCLRSCGQLALGVPWLQATAINSKGCGANMRVAPVGLLPGIDAKTRAAIAQFQAALTHGHPTALAASDLTAQAIADLMNGGNADGLLSRLQAYAYSQREVYHADWLGDLWQRPLVSVPEEFIARGWSECLDVLERVEQAVEKGDRQSDPCLATGDGWIAEEAFATGLLCFLLHPDDPVAAIRRATITKGDSDSIACLTGAFAGAYLGIEAWPQDWIARIEYAQRLLALGRLWDGVG